MYVLINNIPDSPRRDKLTGVHPSEPPNWDRSTQIGREYPASEYAGVTVTTSAGPIPFTQALMERSGAFTFDPATEELVHDPEWRDEV